MGNPSDGFNGKTISLSIKNFWAEVTIFESARLSLTPHSLNDPTEFGSLADLHDSYGRDGYLGGLRLLQATCKKFYQASISCPDEIFIEKYHFCVFFKCHFFYTIQSMYILKTVRKRSRNEPLLSI